MNRGYRRFQIAESGLHDRRDGGAFFVEPLEQFRAVHARHKQVSDQDVGGKDLQLFQSLMAIRGGLHFISP